MYDFQSERKQKFYNNNPYEPACGILSLLDISYVTFSKEKKSGFYVK